VNNKNVIFWTKGIDQLIAENRNVGGLTVQMYFWAKTFFTNDWNVYSFSDVKEDNIQGIAFLKFPTKRYIGIFVEIFLTMFYILKIRPDVIIIRGAGRSLSYLSFFSRIFSVKLIFMGASDTDFIPGEELIKANHDKKLFRTGLRRVKNFIVQNTFQQDMLRKNYNKNNSLIIPNIWLNETSYSGKKENINKEFQNHILWVSNFRKLKRPEWFIELAKQLPQYEFVMVGGAIDSTLFEKCKAETSGVLNLHFLGRRPLNYVNQLFKTARVFVCTSEIEGFPNTFLQAWANNVPVITTFDPDGIISKQNLGAVVTNLSELKSTLEALNENNKYKSVQENIKGYFSTNHDAQYAYHLIQRFI